LTLFLLPFLGEVCLSISLHEIPKFEARIFGPSNIHHDQLYKFNE